MLRNPSFEEAGWVHRLQGAGVVPSSVFPPLQSSFSPLSGEDQQVIMANSSPLYSLFGYLIFYLCLFIKNI